jgi:alanyl-tRNA synthetase
LSDNLKAQNADYVLVLSGGKEGAIPLLVAVGGKALSKVKAGDLVKLLAKRMGGSGGGRPELASGQAKSLAGLRSRD